MTTLLFLGINFFRWNHWNFLKIISGKIFQCDRRRNYTGPFMDYRFDSGHRFFTDKLFKTLLAIRCFSADRLHTLFIKWKERRKKLKKVQKLKKNLLLRKSGK